VSVDPYCHVRARLTREVLPGWVAMRRSTPARVGLAAVPSFLPLGPDPIPLSSRQTIASFFPVRNRGRPLRRRAMAAQGAAIKF
jgi:hypothetical protein